MGPLITFGVPLLAAEHTAHAAHAMAAVLERRLGQPVSVLVAASYSELEDGLAEGQVDFAWLPPYEAARLSEHVGAHVLLRAVRGGFAKYHSILFAREDGPVRSVMDLAGRRIAWVHRRSASGFLIPAAHLYQAGVEPSEPPLFRGTHQAVVQSVLAGEADAGATYGSAQDADATPPTLTSASWNQLGEGEGALRPLVALGPIPSDAVCAWPGTSRGVRDKFVAALVGAGADAADAATLNALFGTDQFEGADPGAFEVLHAASAALARAHRARRARA